MKIRAGFVSNSSSSSYIAIGVSKYQNEATFSKIMKALGLPEDIGYDDLAASKWAEVDYCTYRKHGICLYENDGVYLIGMGIAEDIHNDKRLSEMKTRLRKLFKKIGVDVSPDEIKFEYGEIGYG